MRGRQTLACYRKLELFDCVAENEDDYVRIAVRLAHNRPWRGRICRQIQAGRDRVFGGNGLVGELDAFLENAVRQPVN